MFHLVARGSCWVSANDGDRHWAGGADVMVLPYGDRHTIGGRDPAEAISILTLLDRRPWSEMPTIHHGGGGDRTHLVCGDLHSGDPLFDPTLRALPPAFVVRIPEGATAGWVRASIAYALEESAPSNMSPRPLLSHWPSTRPTSEVRP